MQKIGYPDLANHKKIHQEITNSLILLVKNIKTVNEFKEKLNIITEKWLLEHIPKEDMKYYKYEKHFSQNTSKNTHQALNIEKEDNFELAPEYIIYLCACKNEQHKIPYHIHEKICQGSRYSCKICKRPIFVSK